MLIIRNIYEKGITTNKTAKEKPTQRGQKTLKNTDTRIVNFIFRVSLFFGSLSGFSVFWLVCCLWIGALVRSNFPWWQPTHISWASWLAGGGPSPLLIISSPQHWEIAGLGI